MANVKQLLIDFLATLPDDDAVSAEVNADPPAETEPNTETEPKETEIVAETVEETEVVAPAVDDTDITVINSDDVVAESIDMRLASFYKEQQELATAVKLLTAEVKTLKEHFTLIEKAIDTAAETSPTVETIDSLINML